MPERDRPPDRHVVEAVEEGAEAARDRDEARSRPPRPGSCPRAPRPSRRARAWRACRRLSRARLAHGRPGARSRAARSRAVATTNQIVQATSDRAVPELHDADRDRAEHGLRGAQRQRHGARRCPSRDGEPVSEVVAPAREKRDAGAAPRDAHERRVEDGQAGEQHRGEHVLEAELVADRQRHDARRHHEADRQAAAVAEEDARRRGEVVGQEARGRPRRARTPGSREQRRPRSGRARRPPRR